MKEFHQQKEMVLSEHDKEIDTMKEQQRNEIYDIESRYKDKQDKDSKVIYTESIWHNVNVFLTCKQKITL